MVITARTGHCRPIKQTKHTNKAEVHASCAPGANAAAYAVWLPHCGKPRQSWRGSIVAPTLTWHEFLWQDNANCPNAHCLAQTCQASTWRHGAHFNALPSSGSSSITHESASPVHPHVNKHPQAMRHATAGLPSSPSAPSLSPRAACASSRFSSSGRSLSRINTEGWMPSGGPSFMRSCMAHGEASLEAARLLGSDSTAIHAAGAPGRACPVKASGG